MKKAEQILNKQRDLQKELDDIQKVCKHKDRSIKWENESKSYRWTCDDCQLVQGYPNIVELDKYLGK